MVVVVCVDKDGLHPDEGEPRELEILLFPVDSGLGRVHRAWSIQS